MNNLQWIDSAYLYTKYNAPGEKKNALFVINNFFKEYPTPDAWLYCPEKKRFREFNGLSEFWYILAWMHENNLWENIHFQQIFADYYNSIFAKYHSVYQIAFSQDYITDKDIQDIKKIDSDFNVSALCLVCICKKKNFKLLTQEDVGSVLIYLKKTAFTYLRLQNVLIQLGYSCEKTLRIPRQTNWSILENYPKFGNIFTSYHRYLIGSNAKKDYITCTGTALKHLIKFMDLNNIPDFSSFIPIIFEQLINYLSNSSTTYIPKIKNFFIVNLGEPLFPTEFHFCNSYWSAYTRMQKKLNRQKDGRAFSDITLPPKIVNVLKNHTPQNDLDLLCKNFFLIIASCPARFSYILNLDAKNALQPLPNNPNAYGIYSHLADKAGNIYGQFPILDKIGVNAIIELQQRANSLNLQPLSTPEHKTPFVHLFQLTQKPWLLDSNMLYSFYSRVIMNTIKKDYPDDIELRATAHSFRHYLITHVAMKTGDESICQTAAGHKDIKMTREYLRSKASRSMLLFRIIDKYEQKEITGKFYLRLIELLSSPNTPSDKILHALTTEMELDEFLTKYGHHMDRGYCFSNSNCPNRYACWGCNNFIMTRNEITQAIYTIVQQILELKNLQLCKDFSYEAPVVKHKLKLISLIIKRLTELNLSEEEITLMINNCLSGNELTKGVTK